jgi:glutamyl-tRNA synthetase
VVRGDDHISNTPKQVLLYRAMRATLPAFAHVPLILGPDKKRLSKRHGATSVMEYEKAGYLPQAMFNFLALLGWGTGSDDELLSREELISRFTLDGISGGNAVFNVEKLDWFNHQHLLRLGDDALISRLQPRLMAAGYWRDDLFGSDRDWFVAVLALLKPRAKKLNEFVDQLAPFFEEPATFDADGLRKHLSGADAVAHVGALRDTFARTPAWDAPTLERELRALAEAQGVKAGRLIHAARLAVTGRMVSPGLFEMLALLGRDRVVARLDRFVLVLRGVPRPLTHN